MQIIKYWQAELVDIGKLMFAYALALPVGWYREQEAHSIGVRTFPLVAVASCEDYLKGLIKKHEFTRPDKEDDRVRHIESLDAQTGPVFLVYRAVPKMDEIAAACTAQTPDTDFTAIRDRLVGIVLGITVTTLVYRYLWPENDTDQKPRKT